MATKTDDHLELNGKWLRLAKDAFSSSTTFLDSNYRGKWEDDIRIFHSQHPKSSKYNSESFKYRSRIFRPKTRSVLRKHEATAAMAFFSNLDVVAVAPVDGTKQEQIASAMINKELLNYRLTKTIPWFQMLIGAFQDTMKTGICVSMQYWKFKSNETEEERVGIDPETLKEMRFSSPVTEVYEDCPWIELYPCENLRFSPSAHWYDVVNTSPYVILQIPMYVYQVKAMSQENKSPAMTWYSVTDAEIRAAVGDNENTTASVRRGGKEADEGNNPAPMNDYDVVNVHLNFMQDPKGTGRKVFYTLKDQKMLSKPIPLNEMFWHGEMPIKVGYCVLDSHNPIPDGLIDLGRQLQTEANEIANQRLDNVKLVLNKRWLVKRNANVDTESLLRNVPGGVTMVGNTAADGGDIREVNWQDVTASSYQEQDRVNVDYDDLLGNFASSSVMTNRKLNETVGGMRMMAQGANTLVEYTIRTFVETWVEPVLRQLLKLEQHYESDAVILALAGDKAGLYQRFGIDQVTDNLLMEELTVTVNVGMGATDPQDRLTKFLMAVQSWTGMAGTLPSDANPEEIKNELFGLIGYKDSNRFFSGQKDERLELLSKKFNDASQVISQLQQQLTVGLSQEKENRKIDERKHRVELEAAKVDIHTKGAWEQVNVAQQINNLEKNMHQMAKNPESQKVDPNQRIAELTFDQWKAELEARTKIEIAEISAQATLTAAQAKAASDASKEKI